MSVYQLYPSLGYYFNFLKASKLHSENSATFGIIILIVRCNVIEIAVHVLHNKAITLSGEKKKSL